MVFDWKVQYVCYVGRDINIIKTIFNIVQYVVKWILTLVSFQLGQCSCS